MQWITNIFDWYSLKFACFVQLYLLLDNAIRLLYVRSGYSMYIQNKGKGRQFFLEEQRAYYRIINKTGTFKTSAFNTFIIVINWMFLFILWAKEPPTYILLTLIFIVSGLALWLVVLRCLFSHYLLINGLVPRKNNGK